MKHLKILAVFMFIMSSVFVFSACVPQGLPNMESYKEYIEGITAGEEDTGEMYINLDTLINDKEFDETLQEKKYCGFEIKQNKPCYIKGIVFIIKSQKDAEITFQAKAVLKNRRDVTDITITNENDLDLIISAKKVNLKADTYKSIFLYFPDTLSLRENELDKLVILAAENQSTGENCEAADIFKVSFKFDGLLIFFDPEFMN